MTIDCGNKLDAAGCAITRIRDLGVPADFLLRHTADIADGAIVASRDLPGKPPRHAIAGPLVRWATIKGALGL